MCAYVLLETVELLHNLKKKLFVVYFGFRKHPLHLKSNKIRHQKIFLQPLNRQSLRCKLFISTSTKTEDHIDYNGKKVKKIKNFFLCRMYLSQRTNRDLKMKLKNQKFKSIAANKIVYTL